MAQRIGTEGGGGEALLRELSEGRFLPFLFFSTKDDGRAAVVDRNKSTTALQHIRSTSFFSSYVGVLRHLVAEHYFFFSTS